MIKTSPFKRFKTKIFKRSLYGKSLIPNILVKKALY